MSIEKIFEYAPFCFKVQENAGEKWEKYYIKCDPDGMVSHEIFHASELFAGLQTPTVCRGLDSHRLRCAFFVELAGEAKETSGCYYSN